ncbi:sulfotransferase family protein [Pseudomonas protegens]|uniref:sulfotransferase family protein n=1 Tax=Pseudomonas protegens TaxID=380021 RepID=UPI0024C31E5A|nr:sulfotransferase [Pseudomonas protegens]MDK1400038.1 sulfotransferase [Pseudomonas protegens]
MHANTALPTQQLIVVLGMHRSGTSAITRGLQVLGVALGDNLMPAIEGNNAKGFWEDLDIVNFNEELLSAVNSTWHNLNILKNVDVDHLCNSGYLNRAIVIIKEKLSKYTIFGFKDPRTTKLLPFWTRAFSLIASQNVEIKYILSLRNPLSVASSLAKRNGFSPVKAYLLWIEHVLTSLSYADLDAAIVVDYDQLMLRPEGEIHRISSHLGTELDPKELSRYCNDFIDSDLQHTVFQPKDILLDKNAPELAYELYCYLYEMIRGDGAMNDSSRTGKLQVWEKEFHRLQPIIRYSETLQSQIYIADESICQLNKKLDAQQGIISELESQVKTLERSTDSLTTLAENRRELLSQAETNLNVIRSSLSWKITSPLRWLALKIKFSKSN